MIRVLVVEDSSTARRLLIEILQSDPELEVVGEAGNGVEALQKAIALRPDIITMDVHMPLLDGLAATKEIMVEAPTPIVLVSAGNVVGDVELSLDAIQAGALTVVPKPVDPRHEHFEEQAASLISTVKSMAGVKVVRRWGLRVASSNGPTVPPRNGQVRIVAIGASTGGPAALRRILIDLPRDFPAPITIVQHIAKGFVEGFARWLGSSCNLRVTVASAGEPMVGGTVYIAPDDRHLGVRHDGRIALSDDPAIGGFRPSATYLFRSCAAAYGDGVVALVLSGMGADGVVGLEPVRAAGGRVIVQDERSCVVFGMGQETVRAGLATAVVPIQEIAPRLVELVA